MKKQAALSVHTEEVQHKILDAAKRLFVHQGYRKTTIRQIVEESGVLTGSIYHFFKNKEDVFQALILQLLRRCIGLIDERFQKEGPAFKYAAMCVVELKAVEMNALVRETYYEGYSSKIIFEKMVEHVSHLSEKMFHEKNLGYSYEDYYLRTLLIKGAMRSCVAEFYFSRQVPAEKCWQMLIEMALPLFHTDETELQEVQQRILRMQPELHEIAAVLIKRSLDVS